MKGASAVALVIVLGHARVAAQDLPRSESRWSWFLPELAINAKTSGKADFSLKGSFAWGVGESHDLLFWPIGRVQTDDGVARLLTIDGDAATESDPGVTWRVGGAIGIVKFSDQEATPIERVHAAYAKADATCRATCPSANAGYCKSVRDLVLDAQLKREYTEVSIDSYCLKSQIKYREEIDKKSAAALADANSACGTSVTDPSTLCPKGMAIHADALAVYQKSLFEACWNECSGLEPNGFCKEARRGEIHENIDSQQLCTQGKAQIVKLRDESARLPPLTLSLGVIAGRDPFAYYVGASGSDELRQRKQRIASAKAGFFALRESQGLRKHEAFARRPAFYRLRGTA